MVDLYQSCRENIERNLHLRGLTTRHAPPDLTKTYAAMSDYLQMHGPNEYRSGRKTAYSIPDIIDRGQAEIEKMTDCTSVAELEGLGDDDAQQDVEDEDVITEL